MDRRQLLVRGGVAAGAAVALPMVTPMPAFASTSSAGSVLIDSFDDPTPSVLQNFLAGGARIVQSGLTISGGQIATNGGTGAGVFYGDPNFWGAMSLDLQGCSEICVTNLVGTNAAIGVIFGAAGGFIPTTVVDSNGCVSIAGASSAQLADVAQISVLLTNASIDSVVAQ